MLCEKLGFPSPRHLLVNLRETDVKHWHAYYRIMHGDADGADSEEQDLANLVADFQDMRATGLAVSVDGR